MGGSLARKQMTLPGFKSTATGLVPNKSLTAGQWEEAGELLGHIDARLSWFVGDWLIAGETQGYLERGKLDEACEQFGIAYQTANDSAVTCRSIEQSMRRPILSYGHHREVANRPDAEELLDWCEETGASREELRAEKRRRTYATEHIPPPRGKYDLIYADPPWRYEHSKAESRKIENHYPTMELEDICELAVSPIASDDCVLFLWATSPKLAESFHVLEAWGFSYRTCMIWRKDKIGMGYYARQLHELLLICTRGKPGTPDPSVRPHSVIDAPRQQHSKKPDVFYEIIESMYPDAKKIELFARERRKGWKAWGNQSE